MRHAVRECVKSEAVREKRLAVRECVKSEAVREKRRS